MHKLQGNIHELQGKMHKLQGNLHELQGNMHELQGNMHELQGNMHELQGIFVIFRTKMLKKRLFYWGGKITYVSRWQTPLVKVHKFT